MPGLQHSLHDCMVSAAASATAITSAPSIKTESAIALRQALSEYGQILLQRLPEHISDWTCADEKAFEQAVIVAKFAELNDPAADLAPYVPGVRAMVAYRTSKQDNIIPLFVGDFAHTVVKPSAINHLIS